MIIYSDSGQYQFYCKLIEKIILVWTEFYLILLKETYRFSRPEAIYEENFGKKQS